MKLPYLENCLGTLVLGVFAAGAFIPQEAQGDWELIDDFENYQVDLVREIDSPWTAHGGSGYTAIIADGDNQLIGNGWSSNFRSGSRALPASTEIQPGENATFFLQFKATSDTITASFGLAHDVDTEEAFPFEDYRVETRLESGDSGGNLEFQVRDGGEYRSLTTVRAGTWYNLWYVIDRTDEDRFRLYLTPGTDVDATEGARLSYEADDDTVDAFSFRDDEATDVAIDQIMLIGHTSPNWGMHYDNMWMDNTGENLTFTGLDFEGWQLVFEEIEAPFTLHFGTGAGEDGEEILLRNRPDDFLLQSNSLRYISNLSNFISSSASASVGNYLSRQDFMLESEMTLRSLPQVGDQRVGFAVLGGPHVPFEDPFNTAEDEGFYGLIWSPAVDTETSLIEIREGFDGDVLAEAVWEGLHPNAGDHNEGIGTTYQLEAEGVYDLGGGLDLTFTLTDANEHSQEISTFVAHPFAGDHFGIGGRLQSTDLGDSEFDFQNFSMEVGDEPLPLVSVIDAPFSVPFGSDFGRAPGNNFDRTAEEDWTLEPDSLQLTTDAGSYYNSLAVSRVENFEPGRDFFLGMQMTLGDLDAAAADNRVGVVLFGEEDPEIFDPEDDATYTTFQWIPNAASGASIVVREGMDGTIFAETNFAELDAPPLSPSSEDPEAGIGVAYNLEFHAEYADGGNLEFTAVLTDGVGGEAEVSGTMPAPSESQSRFGFGARHRAQENPVWDIHRLSWFEAIPGYASVVAHEGSTDPEEQGFSVVTNDRVAASGEIEGGIDYWELVDPAPGENPGHLWYQRDLEVEDIDNPQGWRVSSIMRVIDSQDDGYATLAFYVRDGSRRWAVTLVGGEGTEETQGVYYDAAVGQERVVDMDTTDAFHRYELVFDPAGNGGEGLATLYVNGESVTTLAPEDVRPDTSSPPQLRWGSASNALEMQARWNLAEFAVANESGEGFEPVVTHEGNTDPVDQGFTRTTNGRVASGGGTEGGTGYWELIDPAPGENPGHLWYQRDLAAADVSHPFGWRASAVMRVIDSQDDAYGTVAFYVRDGSRRWAVTLVGGEGTDETQGVYYDAAVDRERVVDMDTTDAFHRYELVFDPAGNGGEGLATLYVNGVSVATLAPEDVRPDTSSPPQLRWGSASNALEMHAQWNFAEFAVVLGREVSEVDLFTSFEDWQLEHFSESEREDPAISGPEAAPAGDGIANLLKYAFGLDPFSPAAGVDLSREEIAEGMLRLTYLERTDAADIDYVPELSGDLDAWDSGPEYVEEVGRVPAGTGFEEVTVQALLPEEAIRGFLRVSVRQE